MLMIDCCFFQNILLDFVNIELSYHAKALEMYTMCFQSLNTMDEEEDLEVRATKHSVKHVT